MTLKERVLEMIGNAYENGYEAEIKDLTDEELAEDLWCYEEQFYVYTVEEITAAVKEVRNVH